MSSEKITKFTDGLPKKSVFENKKIWSLIGSAIAGISVIAMVLFVADDLGFGQYKNVGIITGALIAIVPFTLFQLQEVQRKDNIDRNMPMLLLSLLSSVKTGTNLEAAIEAASHRNLGHLTPPLKNLSANLTWGFPVSDCFKIFAEKTGTRISKRVSTLLQMAVDIGGDITENLEMIQKHVSEMIELEKNRKSALTPYMYTIYISFAVFVGIALLLTLNFVPEIEKVKLSIMEEEAKGGGGFSKNDMFAALRNFEPEQLKSMMFNMSIIEAIFGGLAVGKITSSSYIAGAKHVVVMVVIAVIAFTVI